MKNDTWNVGTQQLCAFFGISDETTRTWVKAGCPKIGHGSWNLKSVYDWWCENINSEQSDSEPLSEAKRLYWGAKAESERLKVDQAKGNLVSWPDIEREWTGRLSALVSGLQCFIDRLPPLLEGKSRPEIRKIIESEIFELRSAYAREGRYCPQTQQ